MAEEDGDEGPGGGDEADFDGEPEAVRGEGAFVDYSEGGVVCAEEA